jgi:hypothetical protein
VKFEIRPEQIASLNRELKQRAALVGKTIKEVTREEGRPLVRDLVNATAPRQPGIKHTTATAPQADRKLGLNAIENDINRMFRALNTIEAIYNPQTQRFGKEVRRLLRLKAYKELGDILFETKILPFRPKIIDEATEELHRKWRVPSTGKVSAAIKNPWLVVKAPSIKRLIRKLQKRVGYGKSGWSKSLLGMGMGVPAWIDKGGPGDYKPEAGPHRYAITFSNRVSYMQRRAPRILSEALRRRTESLANRSKAILEKRLRG